MSAHSVAPGAQQKRFAAYLDRLAQAAGHLDRVVPLKSYCTGLLLPGERKSVEPMAARLCPNNVRQTHQSLHHVVAHAPWRDEDILEAVAAGKFHIWPVAKIEQGIEILTGMTAGSCNGDVTFQTSTVFAKVNERLSKMAQMMKGFE